NPEYGVELYNPRSYADWATNCGALGVKVDHPEQLDAAFDAAFAKADGPSLIECVVDPNEPPLPPITPAQDAVNMLRAIVKGQKEPLRIAVTMFRDKLDEVLVQGLGKIPGPEAPDEKDAEKTGPADAGVRGTSRPNGRRRSRSARAKKAPSGGNE